MKIFRQLFILLLVLFFAGCATPHLYPVCFYNQSPSKEILESYYTPHLRDALRAALGDQREILAASTPDARWFVAKTTNSENSDLAKVWPRIGCIGDASTGDGVRSENGCVDYLQRFISKENYFEFGNAKDAGGIDIWSESPNPKIVVRCESPSIG